MLNVLHVVGDSVGGIRKHIHDVIFGLNEEFNFFYICSHNVDDNFKIDLTEMKKLSVNVEQLKINKKPSFNDIRNIIYICKFIKLNKIDIVHGHGAKGGVYARAAGKLAQKKVIYTPHGGVVHSMFNRYEDYIYSNIERVLKLTTDLYVFESNYTKNSFLNKIKASDDDINFVVNYNGVSTECSSFSCSSADEKLIDKTLSIGFFGMLRAEKGVLFSLSVIKALIKKYPINFYIYGDGHLYEQISDIIKNESLGNRVFLQGYTNDVLDKMSKVDIVFIPSLFESFGYVAVEAMLLRKPFVVSDAGALPEVCGDNYPYMYSHESVHAAVSAFDKILEDMQDSTFSSHLNCFSTRARNKFNLNSMTNTLKLSYEAVSKK